MPPPLARRVAQEIAYEMADVEHPEARAAFGVALDEARRSPGWRDQLLEGVCEALTNAGMLDEAEGVADTLEEGHYQYRARRLLAEAFVKRGNVGAALRVLSYPELDKFIEMLALWAPALESIEGGSSASLIRTAVSIVAWVREDWKRIDDVLRGALGTTGSAHLTGDGL